MPVVWSAASLLAAADVAGVPSDEALVGRAQTGSAEARNELASRHRDSAYLLALQLLRNRDDALDVAQEAMLRFFSTLNQVQRGRPVRPWLLTIVRNQVRDLWRRRRVRHAESIDTGAETLAAQLVDGAASPEEDAYRRELRRSVWRALDELSADQREIIVLRDFHDLSYDEISEVLAIRPGTVMSRLHGARKQLRVLLERGNYHA